MSLPRERFGKSLSQIDSPTRQLISPGRPASVPLRHTIASSVRASHHSLQWLDGVSDVILDPLWRSRTTGIQNDRRLPGTTRPRVRSPWRAAYVVILRTPYLYRCVIQCMLLRWVILQYIDLKVKKFPIRKWRRRNPCHLTIHNLSELTKIFVFNGQLTSYAV